MATDDAGNVQCQAGGSPEGATVTGSTSAYGSNNYCDGSYTSYCSGLPEMIIDGATASTWGAASMNAYITIDYNELYYIPGTWYINLKMNWDTGGYGTCGIEVFTSTDAVTWTTIADNYTAATTESGSWISFAITADFRYIRVGIGSTPGGDSCGWFGVSEVMVGGDAGADLAEQYITADNLSAGDLVSIKKETDLYKEITSQNTNSEQLLGVISTNAHTTMGVGGNNQNLNNASVALAGRVPAKVLAFENQMIDKADSIGVSLLPGIAAKATEAGYVAGKALETTHDWSATSCTNVNSLTDIVWPNDDGSNQNKPCFRVPVASLDNETKTNFIALYNLTETDYFYVGKIMTFVNLSYYEPVTTRLTLKNIASKVSFDEFGNIVVDKLIAKKINTEQISAREAQIDVLGATTISTDNLQANLATINQLTVNQDLQVHGPLTTDLMVAGVIDTNTLTTDNLTTSNLTSGFAVMGEATVSGTLYANHIQGLQEKILDSLQDVSLLSSPASGPSMAEIEADLSLQGITLASDLQSTLDELNLSHDEIVLSPSAAYLDKYLEVNGNAYLAKSLGLGENLLIGTGLLINADGLTKQGVYAISAEKIQINPAASGTLSLMADTLVIDQKGLVQINGDLNVTGKTISKEMETETIKAQEVSGGNLEAKSLNIESEDLTIEVKTEYITSKDSGKATIPAGVTTVILHSTQISENTLIYLTPLGPTNKQTLFVSEQIAEDPDTEGQEGLIKISLEEPLEKDLKFNWWIIN